MTLTPDALHLGPLALAWEPLALLLGLGVWLGTARFGHAGGAALVTLVTARLASALPHWADLAPTLPGRLVTLLDLRAGDWNWTAGVLIGTAYLLLRLRRWPAALPRSVLLTAAAVGLPLLFHPVPPTTPQLEGVMLDRVTARGEVTPVLFEHLPRPAVVNVWATWCGPCRAELPVLARAIQAGAPVILVNADEAPNQVRHFLGSLGLQTTTFIDHGNLLRALRISGYPTTFVIDRKGRVTARHLGPLNTPQLQALLHQAKDPPP